MLLQNFNFRFDDPSYQLKIKQTLTIKPKDFFMYATLRDHVDPVYLEKSLYGDSPKGGKVTGKDKIEFSLSTDKTMKPMTVLYGSNSGTCEALAQSLARVVSGKGFRAQVEPLDLAVGKVPKGQPVILTSSATKANLQTTQHTSSNGFNIWRVKANWKE
jgi:cytochrome P450/NADPH-cytochrome P450 reductase